MSFFFAERKRTKKKPQACRLTICAKKSHGECGSRTFSCPVDKKYGGAPCPVRDEVPQKRPIRRMALSPSREDCRARLPRARRHGVSNRRRYPHGEFALQCVALYRDIADSMAELQKGIDDFSALASANAENA